MKHQDGFFKNDQGQSIYYQSWLPDNKPRAVLLVVHGVNEHSGRYRYLAEYFSAKGFGVYGLDLVGHGKSSGTRSYAESFDAIINPILAYLDMIKQSFPHLPVFLIGHSLGGMIGVYFMIDHQEKIAGAVLSGTLSLVPDYVSDATITIGRLLSKILPKLGIIALDIDGISRDPKVVQAYRDDPLVYTGKMTTRISNIMNEGIARIAAEGEKITEPVLFLHGGADRICDPECSKYLHNLVSSQENQLIIYDELLHEVYNEPERDAVLNDVLGWLEEQLS